MKTRKILLSLAAVGTTASLAGIGTFASFTGSASEGQAISTGTLTIALGASGGSVGDANNRLSIGASNIVPGDSLQRRVTLRNSGNVNLASITLTTTSSTSTVLTTDGTNGLQLKIEKCGGASGWHESASTPYTYTCDQVVSGDNLGTRTTVLAQRAVVGSALALSSLSSLTSGTNDDLVVTETLPSSADNTFQTLSSTITYTFNATQRTGTSQ